MNPIDSYKWTTQQWLGFKELLCLKVVDDEVAVMKTEDLVLYNYTTAPFPLDRY